MPMREFELAYEFDSVTYAPGRKVWEWEVLIQFEITGLRHEQHGPRKDIPFFSSRSSINGIDDDDEKRRRIEEEKGNGAVPGVTSIVRLVLGYTDFEEMRIMALELMPKDNMAPFASEQIEALRKAAALKGEKSITTKDWGGRLHNVNGPDGKDMYVEHVSFQPGEWNDCGRKDEWGRQTMCKLWDFAEDFPVLLRVLLVLVVMFLVGLFVGTVFVCWIAIRLVRGRRTEEMVTVKGEDDALLLFGDEELEEEIDDEKEGRGMVATQTLDQGVQVNDHKDSQHFGPYQHNVGTDL